VPDVAGGWDSAPLPQQMAQPGVTPLV
jgi:hypothetical protein